MPNSPTHEDVLRAIQTLKDAGAKIRNTPNSTIITVKVR